MFYISVKNIRGVISFFLTLVQGLITFEDKTDPSYLLIGAPSISNSSSLSAEAEIILGSEGANLSA